MKKVTYSSYLMKTLLRRFFASSIAFLFTLIFGFVFAQNTQMVTGKVTDANGETLPGVNVIVKGSQIGGTITDIDGKFSIEISNLKELLVFSYIGYTTKSVSPQTNKPMLVVMEESSKTLDEVVVVGFGTQRKVNLTGSVSVIDNKTLAERPARDAIDMLQGTTPGLNISRSSGNLDKTADINIRGVATLGEGSNGSPLILIDGVEGSLSGLNPQDIENISVLKDAAAASVTIQ